MRSQNAICVLLVCAVSLTLVFSALPVGALLETKVLTPTADSCVDAADADANKGREWVLRVRPISQGVTLTFGYLTYLMFDLSSIPSDASVEWAKLRLLTEAVDIKALVGVYYCSNNDWAEDGITFNNMPSFSQTTIDTANVTTASIRYEWNITETVKSTLQAADKRLSLVLRADTSGSVLFYSRQNPFSRNYDPYLVIQYDAPPQTGIYIPKELIIIAVIGAAAIGLEIIYLNRKRRKPQAQEASPIGSSTSLTYP